MIGSIIFGVLGFGLDIFGAISRSTLQRKKLDLQREQILAQNALSDTFDTQNLNLSQRDYQQSRRQFSFQQGNQLSDLYDQQRQHESNIRSAGAVHGINYGELSGVNQRVEQQASRIGEQSQLGYAGAALGYERITQGILQNRQMRRLQMEYQLKGIDQGIEANDLSTGSSFIRSGLDAAKYFLDKFGDSGEIEVGETEETNVKYI